MILNKLNNKIVIFYINFLFFKNFIFSMDSYQKLVKNIIIKNFNYFDRMNYFFIKKKFRNY